ncbi:MAG: hypothetical protein DRN12_06955 [Thermoplasmata archaeon]|nr:MAG: hypothetical protein DRN12_06955 [Thermoplasmata archaeon]
MNKGKYRIGSLEIKKGIVVMFITAILAMAIFPMQNARAYTHPCPIAGVVYDENGYPVANAIVRIRDVNTGAWGWNVTDANGNYTISLGGNDRPWTEWFYGDTLIGTVTFAGKSGANVTIINETILNDIGHLWLNFTLGTPVTEKHIGEPQFIKYDYDDGTINSGELVSAKINITADVATLSFWTWWQIEGVNSSSYDLMNVSISTDGGYTFTLLKTLNPDSDPTTPSFRDYMYYSSAGFNVEPVWVYEEIDISAYVPCDSIVLKFSFDTNDTLYNYWEGWYIDDIKITEFGGNISLNDDVENGVQNWTYTGYWHISEHRSHSSSHSWYYGIEHSYVTSDTPFNFTAQGDYTSIQYNISNGSAFTGWHAYVGNFTFANELSNEEGLYYIEFYAENDTNSEPMHLQSHMVDNSYPESTYEFGEPNANLTYNGYNYTTIKICTPLWINASDGDGAGVEWLNYSVWWNPDEPDDYQHLYDVNVHDNDENDTDKRVGFISVVLHFNEECFHEIKWDMVDYLGHESPQHSIDIAVDATAPDINKTIGEPKYIDENNNTWVNCSTIIWVNVTDDGCGGGVGVWNLIISVYWNETGGNQQLELVKQILIEDGGLHDIDGARDGNISYIIHFEGGGFYRIVLDARDYLNNSHVFIEEELVDALPPTSKVAEIIPHQIEETPFNVTVVDIEDHGCGGPVGVCKVELYYNYSFDNTTWLGWTLYATYNVPWSLRNNVPNWTVSFDAPYGAGFYRFKSIAYDCVGNVEQPPFEHGTYDTWCQLIADREPPVVTKEYGQPCIEVVLGDETLHIIRSDTPIYINATDMPEEDWTGIDKIFWSFDGIIWYETASYEGSHTASYILTAGSLPEGGPYHIFYKATDMLGHESDEYKQKFFIDNSAPSTTMTLDCNGKMPFNITINASDNIAGVKKVTLYFRYSPDGENWGEWMEYGSYEWGIEERENNRTVIFEFIYNPDGGYYKPGYYEFYAYAEDYLDNAKSETPTAEGSCEIEPIAEDLNGDGHVNVADLYQILMHWGETGSPGWIPEDVNKDGVIDVDDIYAVILKWTG